MLIFLTFLCFIMVLVKQSIEIKNSLHKLSAMIQKLFHNMPVPERVPASSLFRGFFLFLMTYHLCCDTIVSGYKLWFIEEEV